jgi:hypothetical protein
LPPTPPLLPSFYLLQSLLIKIIYKILSLYKKLTLVFKIFFGFPMN